MMAWRHRPSLTLRPRRATRFYPRHAQAVKLRLEALEERTAPAVSGFLNLPIFSSVGIPTAVSVTTSPDPSLFGELVTFTARVTATTPGAPMPVGRVTFSIDGTVLAANVGLGNGEAARGTAAL